MPVTPESRLTGAPGAAMCPRVLLDLLRMNVAPLAVFQVLKSMCAGQRLPPGPEGGPAAPMPIPADSRGTSGAGGAVPGLSPLCSRAEPPSMAGPAAPSGKGPGPACTSAPAGLVFIVFSSEGAGARLPAVLVLPFVAWLAKFLTEKTKKKYSIIQDRFVCI